MPWAAEDYGLSQKKQSEEGHVGTAWQKRQTLPHEEKCIFVPQRHSRTSVTLRAVGKAGPGRSSRLHSTWVRAQSARRAAERTASSPKAAAVCSCLPTLGSQARFWLRTTGGPRKNHAFFLKGQSGEDTPQNTDV